MLQQRLRYLILSSFAVAVIGTASSASANCRQVHELLAQGFSVGEVAAGLGAPIGAVQACLQPVAVAGPSRRIIGGSNPAGPAPIGAAGPPPLGAAGPPPLGAPGPPPLGAAGPAPIGAAATSSGMSIRTR